MLIKDSTKNTSRQIYHINSFAVNYANFAPHEKYTPPIICDSIYLIAIV